jgi:hypothetical protein
VVSSPSDQTISYNFVLSIFEVSKGAGASLRGNVEL